MNMKVRIAGLLLLLTSLIGYLEWGNGQTAFLFQVEYGLFFGGLNSAENFQHPFIFLPLLGQVLILITIFQQTPNRMLMIGGIACISVLMLMILIVGVLSLHATIAVSSCPFLILSVWVYRNLKFNRRN